MKTATSLEIRLFKGTDVDENGCWVWRGAKTKDGYGRMMCGSRTDGTRGLRLPHRVAYELFKGAIGDLEIDHLCKNRACCNPEHLEAVTRSVNCERGDHSHLREPRPWRQGIPKSHPRKKRDLVAV